MHRSQRILCGRQSPTLRVWTTTRSLTAIWWSGYDRLPATGGSALPLLRQASVGCLMDIFARGVYHRAKKIWKGPAKKKGTKLRVGMDGVYRKRKKRKKSWL